MYRNKLYWDAESGVYVFGESFVRSVNGFCTLLKPYLWASITVMYQSFWISIYIAFRSLRQCPSVYIYIVLIKRSHTDNKHSVVEKQDLCSKIMQLLRGPE